MMQHSKWAPREDEPPKPTPPPAVTANESAPAPAAIPAPAPPAVDNSYDPAYDDPSVDPFAQTASTDDLFFDDDITPIAEPVIEPPVVEPAHVRPPTAPRAHLTPQTPREPRNTERGGRGRGRAGRGRGRGRGGHVGDIRETENVLAAASAEPAATSEPVESPATPAAPVDAKDKPTHSVRGDRTLTGGPARTRLTEDQLNAKLATMRSKNEALQTAHAKAEADLANFEAREAVMKKKDGERKKVLAEKQKAERQNRQQMMGEREKNRQRKLNAQGGREWDHEKEEGFSGTGEERRRAHATRGAHGGIAPSRPAEDTQPPVSSEQAEVDVSYNHRGRGRGRGGRGSRGGRGDHDESRQGQKRAQRPPSAAEFPELPASTPAKDVDISIKGKWSEALQATGSGDTKEPRPGINKHESFGLPSPMEKGRSWADEVA